MLMPAPTEAKDRVEQLLSRIANEKQKATLEHVQSANMRLDKKPQSVAEFVDLLAFVG